MGDLERAEALIALRRWPEAAALLGRVVASEPGALRPRCLLAQALLGAKEGTEALRQAEAAIAANPTSEWAHRLRSMALSQLGDLAGALDAARDAVRLRPGLVNAHVRLVDAALGMGYMQEAEEAARRAREQTPLHPDAHNALGRVALARHEDRIAESHFRDGLRLAPEHPALLNNLGLALSRQGKRRQAVALFAHASKADPTDDAPHRNAAATAAAGGGLAAVVVIGEVAFGVTQSAVAGALPLAAAAVGVVIGAMVFIRVARLIRAGMDGPRLDPVASRKLMRSLRGRVRAPVRAPAMMSINRWVWVAVGGVALLMAGGAFVEVLEPTPGDPTSRAMYGGLLVACLGGAATVWAILRRREQQPYI